MRFAVGACACVCACAVVAAAGCGLDVRGTLAPAEGEVQAPDASASAPDASGVTPPGPPVPCNTSATTCTAALPAGWTPIAFAPSRSAGCPSNFQSRDVVSAPAAQSGACSCGCAFDPSDPPTCAKGSFTGVIGSTSCTTASATFTFDGTGCTAVGSTLSLSAYAKLTPVAAHQGKCTTSNDADPSKITAQEGRACEPPSACAEDLCLGTAPAGFAACVAHDGDVACPGAPYANRQVVGAQATLACSGCSTCQNAVTCGTATIRYYNDMACATQVGARVADGQCNTLASGSVGAASTYFRYDVTTLAACAAIGTPTPAVGLDQARTICCR